MVNVDTLLRLMFEKGASDLHITAGAPPMLRIDGVITATEYEKLRPEVTQQLIYSILTDEQKEKFEKDNELDISFGVEGVGRVRMNVFQQRGSIASVMRNIPSKIRTFDDLKLPPVIKDLVLSLIHISEPTRQAEISYAVFC